jgi:RNA polymerase sigma-70 factor (ECF subfamily)
MKTAVTMTEFGEDAASCGDLTDTAADEGCDESFALLVKRQSQFVFRVAFSVVRNVQDAEDVVQETFLKLYKSGAWRRMNDEKAFLARSAWRIAVDRIERIPKEAIVADAIDGQPSAEWNLMRAESDGLIHRLMDALPAELRMPLALASVEGMTSAQIAAVMGIPEGTVRRRRLQAREILKQKLKELGVRHD